MNGEQTYCQKWIFDKMPKIVLGHNGEKIFPKCRLGAKCRFFFLSYLIKLSSPTYLKKNNNASEIRMISFKNIQI
jgi:hypothetical protein